VGKQGNTGAGETGNGRRHEVNYEGTLQLWVKSVLRDITGCTSIWMEIFLTEAKRRIFIVGFLGCIQEKSIGK
jgi:hypothetical protein